MTELPIRRVAMVLTVYVVVAWIVLQLAEWLRGVLALPPLFDTLLLGMIAVGVPVAVLVAWRYPDVGGADSEGR